MKTSIRAAGIKSISNNRGGLGASELHGKRLDAVSQNRIITAPHSINWSKAGEDKGLDLIEAFKAHKKEMGAVERGKTEIGTHLLVVVPPEWIKEGGDIHDPNNPNTLKAIDEAVKWAESWQGKGSVFAYRFDLDEKGTGVIDLFTAPVFEQGRRNGKTVKTISPSMAKRALVKQTGEKTSGAAFQTSWSYWAEMNLDPRMERGNRKAETGRDHVHAEVYAREAERAKRQVEEELKQARRFLLQAQRKEEELAKREAAIEANEAKKLTFFNRNQVIQEKLQEVEDLKRVYDQKYRDELEQLERNFEKKEFDLRRTINLEKETLDKIIKQHEDHLHETKGLIQQGYEIKNLMRENSDLSSRLNDETLKRIQEVAHLTLAEKKARTTIEEQSKTIQSQKAEIKELGKIKKIFDFVVNFLKQHFPDVHTKIVQAWNRSPQNPKNEIHNSYNSPSM